MVIGVGLVGLGVSGYGNHLKPLAAMPEYKIVGVCDLSKSLLETRAEEFHVKGYTDFSEMLLNSELELVVIATHPASHCQLAVEAAEVGKHIVVEKPMALSHDEVDQMIAVAERNRVKLTVFQNRRWDPDYLTIRDVVEKGLLGDLLIIDFRFGSYFKYLGVKEGSEPLWLYKKGPGGGLLLNDGVHHIDQVLQLKKCKVEEVFAVTRGFVWTTEVDDYFKVSLTFEDGAVSDIEGSRVSRVNPERWYITGDKGSLKWKEDSGEAPLIIIEEEGKPKEIKPEIIKVDRSAVFYSALYKSLTEGKNLPVDPESVRRTMKVLFAAQKSSETRKNIKLRI